MKNYDGQTEDVPGIKTEQCSGAGFSTTDSDAEEEVADQRNRFEQVCACGERPAYVHIPAQDVACEIEQDDENE
jgi:hypothetical protein